jgi:putative transposase
VRKEMIEHNTSLNIKKKCELLNVARSTMYYCSKTPITSDFELINAIREIYKETSFYGYRRITVELRKNGFVVNHKKVQRLMKLAGIQALYPGKRTTVRNPEHTVFPYLLKGLSIERPNQVWQVDITYIRLKHGFAYLVCLIDVFSRKVMGLKLSSLLDTASCLEALHNALKVAKPEIINSDQGCQFTSKSWIEALTNNNITISMDGKGRWADNVYIERFWRTVKYENVFLHSFDTMSQARIILGTFIEFYNQKRFHQALNYHTPDEVYELGSIPTKQQLFQAFSAKLEKEVGEKSPPWLARPASSLLSQKGGSMIPK